MKVLVLGIGNLLLGDEGIGVHVAQALISRGVPESTAVIDIGTALLEALPGLEEAERVIIVDAVIAGKAPGTIYRMDFDACRRNACIASLHGFDLSRVLALCGRPSLPEVVVIGVEPAHLDWSLELSGALKEALPRAIAAVEEEIDRRVTQKGVNV